MLSQIIMIYGLVATQFLGILFSNMQDGVIVLILQLFIFKIKFGLWEECMLRGFASRPL